MYLPRIAPLAFIIVLLLCPLVSAETVSITDLPFSDERHSQSFHFCDSQSQISSSGAGAQTAPFRIIFSHVEYFKNIHYISVDADTNMPFSEGSSYFWYLRPSDSTYQRGLVHTAKTRNTVGTVTHTQANFYFTNWNSGSATGSKTLDLYADIDGVKSSTKFSSLSNCRNKYQTASTIGGDSNYFVRVEWYVSYLQESYTQTFVTKVHAEAYQNDAYILDVSQEYLSINTKLTRYINGEYYQSSLKIYSPEDVLIFDDFSNKDISCLYSVDKCGKIQVTLPLAAPIEYVLSTGSSPDTTSNFALSLSNPTAAVGDPVTATLTPDADAPAWDEVCYQHIGLGGREEVGYLHNATGWWTTDYSYPLTYTASTEAAATQFNFSAYWVAGTPETDSVYAWVYNEGALVAELQATLTIQPNAGTSSILNVVVIDYSGGSTPILSGATVTCEDAATGASIPQTGSDSTWSRFQVVKGRLYQVEAAYDGYVTGTRTVRPTSDRETLEIYLSRNATVYVPVNDTQVDFMVVDTSNVPVEGALITLTDQTTSRTYTGLTNAYGTRTFVVDAENILKFTVSKSGYLGVSGVVDPSIPGTRRICIAPQTGGTTPGGNTTDPSAADHHAMVNQTLEDAYELVPGIFGFALLMLFFAVIRRGGR